MKLIITKLPTGVTVSHKRAGIIKVESKKMADAIYNFPINQKALEHKSALNKILSELLISFPSKR